MVFFLSVPLYRLRADTLAVIAAATALVLPQVLYPLRSAVEGGSWADAVIAHDPLARITDSDGFIELFITGAYPVLTWLPFVIAGMALGRIDLARPGIRAKVGLLGGALAVLGYGGSWLALHLVPGAQAAVSATTDGGSAASAWWSDAVGDPTTSTPDWLLVAAPHSQTTWSILGNTGVGLMVITSCLIATEQSARFRWLAAPVIAVGSVSLTAYTGHIIAIKALGIDSLLGRGHHAVGRRLETGLPERTTGIHAARRHHTGSPDQLGGRGRPNTHGKSTKHSRKEVSRCRSA
jgi:hypothetical protein